MLMQQGKRWLRLRSMTPHDGGFIAMHVCIICLCFVPSPEPAFT